MAKQNGGDSMPLGHIRQADLDQILHDAEEIMNEAEFKMRTYAGVVKYNRRELKYQTQRYLRFREIYDDLTRRNQNG